MQIKIKWFIIVSDMIRDVLIGKLFPNYNKNMPSDIEFS